MRVNLLFPKLRTDILKLSQDLNPHFIIATHSPAIVGDFDDQMLKMHVLEN